ncbi:MAG: hypothetical protein KAU48_06570 [Candidatus Thorarchaeota archaeon]|nr:hypothetical protein [Candidatus Thorarchaeota archaeon]
MSKTIRGLPEWANLSLKVLFVMIFPLSAIGTNLLQFIFLPTSGLLFTPLERYSVWISDFSTLILILSTYLRNFFVGILIAFPGIYYSYKLSRVPVEKSYWKQGLGTAIAIYLLVLGFYYYMQMSMYSPEFYYVPSFWILVQRIGQYATLVLGVFIILPLIQRQAVIIGSPSELHCYSMREIESNPKLNTSREKILSTIFWFILCFGPMMFQQSSLLWGGGGNSSLSLMISYLLIYDVNRYTGAITSFFSYTMIDFSIFPFLALISAFHFAFVRDTYRYIRKTITRQRFLSMAVFSSIFPLIIMTGMYIPMLSYYFLIPLPIPLLQVVGLLIVKYHRPLADQVDLIWKDDKSKMWWEKDDREQQREEYVESTPEKPHRHREELITVPVTYLFISRIRQLNQRLRH